MDSPDCIFGFEIAAQHFHTWQEEHLTLLDGHVLEFTVVDNLKQHISLVLEEPFLVGVKNRTKKRSISVRIQFDLLLLENDRVE